MQIRPYTLDDMTSALFIFDSNTPDFFMPHERAEFAAFLAAPEGIYLVVEENETVLGCGGYWILPDARTAFLTWGMVHRNQQGRRIGWLLLDHRLNAIRQYPDIDQVKLQTSQHTASFFAKAGFATEQITENGYGPGLDLVDMVLVF